MIARSLSIRLLIAPSIIVALMAMVAPVPAQEPGWSDQFALPGMDGSVQTAVEWNGLLVLGGTFQYVDGRRISNLAAWDGNRWLPVGGGSDRPVRELAVYRGDLVVSSGGEVRLWDGASWEVIPPGPTYFNRPLLVVEDALYMASTGYDEIHVAKWDGKRIETFAGSTISWHDARVRDIAVFRDTLYACGRFVHGDGNGPSTEVLVKWNGSAWEPFPNHPPEYGYSQGPRDGNDLLVVNDELWIGGEFENLGSTSLSHLAIWNGNEFRTTDPALPDSWQSVGQILADDRSVVLSGSVRAANPGIFRLEDESLEWVGEGLGSGSIEELASFGEDVLAIGAFTSVNGVASDGVALLHEGRWESIPLGRVGLGLRGTVHTLSKQGGSLLVGGCFLRAGTLVGGNIARLDSGQWNHMDVSLDCVTSSLPFEGGIVVGASDIRFWRQGSWNGELGHLRGSVRAICEYDSGLVVGGRRTTSYPYGDPSNTLHRWDGDSWHPMYAGLTSIDVFAVAVVDGVLYAGGRFELPRGYTAGLVRWDGDRWRPLEPSLSQSVYALVEYEGTLVAAGSFSPVASHSPPGLARWNGEEWIPFGDPNLDYTETRALAARGRTLVVGADDIDGSQPVVWDGENWDSFESGVQGQVYSLLIEDDGLWVGGNLTTAGGRPSSGIAHWHEGAEGVDVGELAARRESPGIRVGWSVVDPFAVADVRLYRVITRPDQAEIRTLLTTHSYRGSGTFEFLDRDVWAGPVRYEVESWTGLFSSEIRSLEVPPGAEVEIASIHAERRTDEVEILFEVIDPDQRGHVHVWRNDFDGQSVRLTDQPIEGEGRHRFVEAFAPAHAIEYRLEVLRDGEEEFVAGPFPVRSLATIEMGLVQATRKGRDVVLSWDVVDPDARATFHILRYDEKGRRVRLNPSPLGPQARSFVDEAAPPGPIVYFLEVTLAGRVQEVQGPVQVDRVQLSLSVSPNPARETIQVTFALEGDAPARIAIHDAGGREVAVISDETYSAGVHRLAWTPERTLVPGVYVLRLVSSAGTRTQKIIWFH